MVDVNALLKSTKGSARNRWVHMMEVQDSQRVWKIVDTIDDDEGNTLFVLSGARFQYKAEELFFICHADGGSNVKEKEEEA